MASSEMQGRYVAESSCRAEIAALGYPPCEEGIVFKFLPEIGHTYNAWAISSTGNPQPADRLTIMRSESDNSFFPFSAEVENPSFENFSSRVIVEADVPLNGRSSVLVTVTKEGNNTTILVTAGVRPLFNFIS